MATIKSTLRTASKDDKLIYKGLYECDECTRYERSKIRRLSTQWGLGTVNKQITSAQVEV